MFSSKFVINSWIRQTNWVSHGLCWWKPCCRSYSMLCDSKCFNCYVGANDFSKIFNTGKRNRSVVWGMLAVPFLYTGTTFACFQSFGTIPLCKEQQKIAQRIGAVTSLVSLRIIAFILLGPADLWIFKLLNKLCTPNVDIFRSAIIARMGTLTFVRKTGVVFSCKNLRV